MTRSKERETHGPPNAQLSMHSKQFVFFDKKTGARRFEVKADADGIVSMDQAVNMMAIYCVARHQMPRDFNIMVVADQMMVDDLVRRAMKLIGSCSGAMTRLPLSRRQYQVLSGIAQDLSNKEIAAKLNLSERTVKFHVSAMLQKFSVRGRMALLAEAGDCLGAEAAQHRKTIPECVPGRENAAPRLAGATARTSIMIPMDRKAGRWARASNRPIAS
jgi:DNA-binding CsgD family transcriptional regulator